jgi:hypothetical protein
MVGRSAYPPFSSIPTSFQYIDQFQNIQQAIVVPCEVFVYVCNIVSDWEVLDLHVLLVTVSYVHRALTKP